MSFELILPFLRPIEPLVLDDSISEVMGSPDSSWWCGRDGIVRWQDAVSFDAARLRTSLEVIANPLGKRLDEHDPPPVIRPAPALTIRKFKSRGSRVDDLIARGTLTRPLANFLEEQIRDGNTLLISSETGSQAIPERERVVVIEDQPNALLDSFNTGLAGSLGSIHANSAAKELFRFANLVTRSHEQDTLSDVEAEIGETVEFIILTERHSGRRVVRETPKLRGYDRSAKQFLFEFDCEVDHAAA